MAQRIGKYTVKLDRCPHIIGYGNAVGEKEHEGPLKDEFDVFSNDCRYGEKSYEKAESKLQYLAFSNALQRAGLENGSIDLIFAGDLLNQCIGSSFALRDLGIPAVGLYGACSTMALGLCTASAFYDSGAANCVAAVTSSHFCSAERQYRFPLEYGCQRTPTSQWTVTGAGAVILGEDRIKPYISRICIGKIVDLGVCDVNNMGAAMAPSAASTLTDFFRDTGTVPSDYDLIFTGDLGSVGTDLLYELMLKENYDIRCRHSDCGLMIFDRKNQDVESGGSGCGCSASILTSFIMHRFEDNTFKNILFISTGALLSPTSSMQGESIPGISHLVNIRKD